MMILIAIVAFLGLVLRYAVISGGAYWYFWKRNPERFASRRIQKALPPKKQLNSEIKWSLSTFVVFAISAALLYPVALSGKTRMYFEVSAHGWGYLWISIGVLIVLHDTYFYFAHRFMHLKWVFKHVHRVHHESTNPSPLAAFSFHPLEAVIEGLFVFAMIFVLPLHPAALAIFLLFSHGFNVIGHLGYEFFPRSSLLNSATHHNQHHQRFQGNYSLYFNHWDRLLGTL